MFNKCLEFGVFPSTIKIGVIVLFYKEGKSQNDPMSYRPISLLPSIGKLLEKLMSQRLSFHPQDNRPTTPEAIWFQGGRIHRPGLPPLYTQKKQKAFNSRSPQNIQKLSSHLLQDRRVVIPTNEGVAQHIQTTGCPQGSCSGPALWNLVADEALKQQYPAGTSIQAFADDFLNIAAGDSERKLGAAASEALKIFKLWSDKHELQISRDKTQFLQLGNLKRGPSIFWGDRRVKSAPPEISRGAPGQ
ncbi:hypothetical protein AVEN_220203-1 [Araneus ventricosus]|uniref:Reverse transcriptase domain-containing protein n=1 Tax=Araneus ventricosus TaxID=182803 RepID=A0A4Y2GYP6_ARAVE|nr:hypothetical protein AVEN_220203-1 [Araneus ventricosus]